MRGRWRGWRSAARPVLALSAAGLMVAGLAVSASATVPALTSPSATDQAAAARAGTQPSAPNPIRAAPAFVNRPRATRLPTGERRVCGVPAQPGQMACQAIMPTAAGNTLGPASGVPQGYGPASLQSAYGVASAAAHRGGGVTIAIVDAYSNPDLARNLASYRKHFHLPPCTARSGCLKIVNQSGRAGPLPPARFDWGIEESLDLDMVSAICPRCHILLVEARTAFTQDLGAAESIAIAKGVRFVSNSWSGGEFTGQDAFNHDFNHPGDAIVFASGDFGYGPLYPTDTQYVTAVGGTSLTHHRSGRRAWTESVWGGTGSGCSTLEAKPSWQLVDNTAPTGCLNRTENDVSAVADPNTGVAIYDTYRTGGQAIFEVGGTSAATPIITAMYALAGSPARGSYPASYLYRHASQFNHVSSGQNGRCEASRQYLCHGEPGYNGPTGLGTPNGTGGFSSRGVQQVTVLNPGPQDAGVGAGVKLIVPAVDSNTSARYLIYSATGLPAGLKIGSAPRSLNGLITGVLPATAGRYHVTITARDHRTHQAGSTRFYIYVIPSMTAASSLVPAPGSVKSGHDCLSAASQTAGTAVRMNSCDGSVSQQWEYLAGKAPGSPGSLTIAAGVCLGLESSGAVLQTCNGSGSQRWDYLPTGALSGAQVPTSFLYNPTASRCLNGQKVTTPNERVVASACSAARSASGQDWTLNPGVVVLSGTGDCMSAGAGSAGAAACLAASLPQSWLVYGGVFSSNSALRCLQEYGALDGQFTSYETCGNVINSGNGFWLPGPGGELINGNSGRCLADVGTGRRLVQQDCYGQPGEVWAFN